MDGVRGDFLGPSHGTTPTAVIANTLADMNNTKMFGRAINDSRHHYDHLMEANNKILF